MLDETGYRKILVEADDAESDARLGNLEELIGAIADYEEEAEQSDEPATLAGSSSASRSRPPSTRSRTRPRSR